jgi:hypothetical protein
VEERAVEYGIFNLMGSRDAAKPTAEVFAEVAEQTRLADELGYTIAWFAENHFSNYCLCASRQCVWTGLRAGTEYICPRRGGWRVSRQRGKATRVLQASVWMRVLAALAATGRTHQCERVARMTAIRAKASSDTPAGSRKIRSSQLTLRWREVDSNY